MNVCLLTPTFLPKVGGVEMVVSSLADQYRTQNVPTCVVTQHPRPGRGTANDHELPYPVIRYKRPWSFVWTIFMRSIARALETAYQQHPFDVLHCHLVYPVGYVALDFAKKKNIPVVITAHGSDIRPTSRYRDHKHIWPRIVHTIKHADLLTAINTDMQRLLYDILGHANGHVPVIPNGIDLDALQTPAPYQSHWPVAPHDPYLLYLGGLTQKKGVDVLLRAINIVAEKNQNGFALVVAGDGPLRSQLETYTQTHNLAHTVRFTGLVTGDLKRYLLQNCRCVVMPSRTEAMPLVALEAFACQKPLIASNVGGLAELVRHNVTGKLVPPENPQALAHAIRDLQAADPTTFAANTQTEIKKYAWSTIAKKYLAAYHAAIHNQQSAINNQQSLPVSSPASPYLSPPHTSPPASDTPVRPPAHAE